MIETRLLRQFIVVAQELHFHKAAARLHMAQPPLSQAIARLEEKLGFSLLLRNRRGVTLTPAGADFLHSAQRTLETLEQGIQQARDVAQGLAGTLRISSCHWPATRCCSPACDAFARPCLGCAWRCGKCHRPGS